MQGEAGRARGWKSLSERGGIECSERCESPRDLRGCCGCAVLPNSSWGTVVVLYFDRQPALQAPQQSPPTSLLINRMLSQGRRPTLPPELLTAAFLQQSLLPLLSTRDACRAAAVCR